MISLQFSEYNLPNGLHVILCPDKSAPVVAVDVWYHVGSKNEEPTRTGFAHLFEHMMFQGSANVGKAEHMRFIEQAGGKFNGSTTWDRTNYFETLPSNRLELALWLESDRMLSLDISRTNLDNQRKVVKEERRYRVDNKPYGTSWEKIFSMAYRSHPYHWPVVGYMEHLDAASVRDVRSFFGKYYAPNNAVLVVAGEFDVAEARRLVEKYFGEIRAAAVGGADPVADPPLMGAVRDVVHDNVLLPAVFMAFRVPSMTSDDSDALNIAGGILSDGKSSRLYRKLVYEKRIAQSVDAFQLDMEDPGLFLISALVSPGCSPEAVEEEIRKHLHALATRSPHARELAKAKNQFAAGWTRQLSRALGRADNLAHFHTFYGNAGMLNGYLNKLNAVSGSGVREVAEKYLDTENSAVVYYMPREKGRRKNGR